MTIVARRKKAAKRNPTLLTIGNPGRQVTVRRADLERAVAAYREFHGAAPLEAQEIAGDDGDHVYVMLGELREVLYEPRRGARADAQWLHEFGRGAALVASADGKDLRIVRLKGGKVRVDWSRGIVG